MVGTRDKPVYGHTWGDPFYIGWDVNTIPGGISGRREGKAQSVKAPKPLSPHCCAFYGSRARGEGLRGLCSARSCGLISINKANRLKPWPLPALPPLPPLPLAPSGGARLVGHPQAPPGERFPTPCLDRAALGLTAWARRRWPPGLVLPGQARPAHAWQPGSVDLLPSSGRTAGGSRGWLAVGRAAPLVSSMSALALWAGGCPSRSHGTAVFNIGSRHGPSAGEDSTSLHPLR